MSFLKLFCNDDDYKFKRIEALINLRSAQTMASINDLKIALVAFGDELHTDIERLTVAVENAVNHDHGAEIDELMAELVESKEEAQTKFVAALEKLEQAFPPAG